MRTEQISIYKYNELSDKAKEKARDWWRNASCGETYWSECVIDEVKEQGAFMGLDIENVYFSGFWSQGDGACFEGSWRAGSVNAAKVADGWGDCKETQEIKAIAASFAELAKAWPEAGFKVKHRGHYSHENCTDFDVELGDNAQGESGYEGEIDEAESALIETAKKLMRWTHRQLEKAYEDYNSDENIAGNIEANNYEFTVDGKIH